MSIDAIRKMVILAIGREFDARDTLGGYDTEGFKDSVSGFFSSIFGDSSEISIGELQITPKTALRAYTIQEAERLKISFDKMDLVSESNPNRDRECENIRYKILVTLIRNATESPPNIAPLLKDYLSKRYNIPPVTIVTIKDVKRYVDQNTISYHWPYFDKYLKEHSKHSITSSDRSEVLATYMSVLSLNMPPSVEGVKIKVSGHFYSIQARDNYEIKYPNDGGKPIKITAEQLRLMYAISVYQGGFLQLDGSGTDTKMKSRLTPPGGLGSTPKTEIPASALKGFSFGERVMGPVLEPLRKN
jgi:hypothetical protein